MKNTLLHGRINELKCIMYFLELGYVVSSPEIPYRYDFLIDTGKNIIKVQAKSCRLKDDGAVLEFNTASITHNSNGYTLRPYSESTVDYFCTYYDNNCYLIPLSECGKKNKRLRLKPTTNGQVTNVSFAKDYIAKDVLQSL